MRKHAPLADEEGNPLINPAALIIHDHYEAKYGGGKESAKAALHIAVSETQATACDGHRGNPFTFSGEDILTETQALKKKKVCTKAGRCFLRDPRLNWRGDCRSYSHPPD